MSKPSKPSPEKNPCTVEAVKREVIENRLLTALVDNEDTVAILATSGDLEVMIAALEYAMLGEPQQTRKARELASGMRQLFREAFPEKGR